MIERIDAYAYEKLMQCVKSVIFLSYRYYLLLNIYYGDSVLP